MAWGSAIPPSPPNYSDDHVTIPDGLEELAKKLSVSLTYDHRAKPDSIMDFERICECDDAFLCEHRLQWILDYINTNFTPNENK